MLHPGRLSKGANTDLDNNDCSPLSQTEDPELNECRKQLV